MHHKLHFIMVLAGASLWLACSPARQAGRPTQTPLQQLLADSVLQHAHAGIVVADAATGQVLDAHQPNQYFVPASNTKLWTMYAGLKYLGPQLPAAQVRPLADTAIEITTYGDPTFLHPDYSRQPLADVLKKYNTVYWTNPAMATALYGNGWSWNDYTAAYMAPRSSMPMYGNVVDVAVKNGRIVTEPAVLQALMPGDEVWADSTFSLQRSFDDAAIFVSKGRSRQTSVNLYLDAKAGLRLAAAHFGNTWHAGLASQAAAGTILYSQPTDSMLRPLMHRSDNFFAEQTLLMISQLWYGRMNENLVMDSLLRTDLKAMPQKPRWADGSGLSRYNLFTPADYIWLLRKMKEEFGMARLQGILPTGNAGTLTNYYKPLAGKVFAKTGTLSGVVALSGYLYAQSGRLLVFSTLINNHQGSAGAVRRAVEQYLLQVYQKY